METLRGQRALRRGRFSGANHVYLITTVVDGRRPLFRDWAAGHAAARVIHDRRVLGDSHFLAWVLMPDHFHGLLQLGSEATLSETVRRFKGNVALRVNRALGGTGSLWQPGFHDHALRKEEDLAATARYVIANPIRAGLVSRTGDYPFWNAAWL